MEKSRANMSPMISIVTPSLNQAKFIEETIESVLSQAGDFFLEYIIMDGGSTDGSLEIVRKYENLLKEKKYSIVCKGIEYRWVSAPDKGQADAINRGFRMSRGEIIAYLNSDDLYVRDALSKAADHFRRNPAIGMAYGDAYGIELNGETRYYKAGKRKFSFDTMKRKNVVFQPAVFVRRKVLEKAGYLNAAFNIVLDYEWFVRIAKYFQGGHIASPLATFRRHAETKTHNRYAFSYRGEYLMVILKYAGLTIFARSFGDNLIQIMMKRGLTAEEAFEGLKSGVTAALRKQGDDVSSPELEGAFSKGRAYAQLWMACEEALKDRIRAKSRLVLALSQFPSLLFDQYALRTFMRLFVPRWAYAPLKRLVSGRRVAA